MDSGLRQSDRVEMRTDVTGQPILGGEAGVAASNKALKKQSSASVEAFLSIFHDKQFKDSNTLDSSDLEY